MRARQELALVHKKIILANGALLGRIFNGVLDVILEQQVVLDNKIVDLVRARGDDGNRICARRRGPLRRSEAEVLLLRRLAFRRRQQFDERALALPRAYQRVADEFRHVGEVFGAHLFER